MMPTNFENIEKLFSQLLDPIASVLNQQESNEVQDFIAVG